VSDATPSRPSADRNLLFGILALQMDFITRDALIAAMHALVLDKAKSLGQILVAQNALRADQHGALEVLVNLHLGLKQAKSFGSRGLIGRLWRGVNPARSAGPGGGWCWARG
jgi:hypothetical protein